ncbi:hypothetical protein AB0B45_28195 [Nonomuraea sp. NPDC049152]|uniref:hypothetical protein n=1 Tax=Nonomuraea sp. NPDC049152 TaxID=3154350 RepID=UPI0034073B89
MRVNTTPDNVQLIGGEMLLWSDLTQARDWGAIATELAALFVTERGRVLVVGPHPEGLFDMVAARAGSLSALLRSYPDACALATRHPSARVFCGRLDVLAQAEPYDLVLAFDGFAALHSAESPVQSWRESLAALSALIADGGRLILGVENDLGVDRFVSARPAGREGDDSQWTPHGYDVTYPNSPETVERELQALNLSTETCYASFPTREAPRALLATHVLAQRPPDALTVPLSARGYDARMIVADPLHLTRTAFRHELADRLAPLWVSVARKEPSAPSHTILPTGLLQSGPIVHEVIYGGTGWSRSALSAPPVTGRVRMVAADASATIPHGRVLEEILLEGCARDDLRALRDTFTELGAWVKAQTPSIAVFGTTDNLVWDGVRLRLAESGWTLDDAPIVEVVLCRILWRFAVRLLAAGHHHPWPWPIEADQLALTLAGMCGIPCDKEHLESAMRLEEEIDTVIEPGRTPPAYRELLEARDHLHQCLSSSQARVTRLETKLTFRERDLQKTKAKLRKVRRKALACRRTLGYRLSLRFARPRRLARRVLRKFSS